MSRSRKRFPCVKGGGMGKYGKIVCNRKVRRAKDLPSGGAYRKVGSSWDIWDWKFVALPDKVDEKEWEEKKWWMSK
jgi:hypothetical protein